MAEPHFQATVGDPAGATRAGPRLIGLRPGHPFVHRLAGAGGDRMALQVSGLPAGLSHAGGIISGRASARGRYRITVRNGDGDAAWSDAIDLVVGNDICLTPSLGWNSWNCFGTAVTEADVLRAADILVDSGLADRGWTCVAIDDGWQGGRDRHGRIHANDKFEDMRGLCDDLHELGLRVGLYSSPGPTTCGGFEGSAGHERQDAESFAEWGIDYLKYDWCSAGAIDDGTPVETIAAPFARMRAALDLVERDIVYAICDYGFGAVWTWARRLAGANAWRTTGDIEDTWESVERIGFGQAELAPFAGPGGWNDPDMLVLGRLGGGWYQSMRQTRLTPEEQRTHVGLWVLLGAPLLLGCDLAALDALTLELVSNLDVLGVHQDPLGRQARRILSSGPVETWGKELADGSCAVGAFNRGDVPVAAGLEWRELGFERVSLVRELWGQREVDAPAGWQVELPPHGSALLRIWPA